MAAGGPRSDVLHYGLEVYGPDADALLKKLAPFMSRRELWDWWRKEIGWDCKAKGALVKIRLQLEFAETRARENGWETE